MRNIGNKKREYSKFQIWVRLPDGVKQLVWEQTLEGDIVINEKMDDYKNSYESAGHEIVYARRSTFGSQALFSRNIEESLGKIFTWGHVR